MENDARLTRLHHGLLVVNKPRGITSREAVDCAKRWFPPGTSVGHTGTLDPLATGVLVICIGQATRLAEYVQRMTKRYRAGVRLGARSDTDDVEGEIEECSARPVTEGEVVTALASFVGEIDQVPPAFSAAKVNGARAYKLARRGMAPALASRQVRIDRLEILSFEYPRLEIEIDCGSGTYIRSLARDLGERLGCGGLIDTLVRTRVGPFTLAEALTLPATAPQALDRLKPLRDAVVELPAVRLDAASLISLRHGQAVSCPVSAVGASAGPEIDVAVFDTDQSLAAVGRLNVETGLLVPKKVLMID